MKVLNEDAASAWFTGFAKYLSIVLFAVATWIVFEYRDAPLLGLYAFRETQTALTAYWICREGFHFAYSTPVAGFPWSIPLEFPIYQWLVSLFSCTFHVPLDPVGRLVSFGFWAACLFPARIIFRRLFHDRASLYFWTFVAIFLSAPIYLHYGHAFLPESVGLFFTLSFLAYSLELSFGPARWKHAFLCGLFFALASLQKSTTVLPLALFALVYLWVKRAQVLNDPLRSPAFWKVLVAYVIPLAVGFAWVRYSDQVKMANAFGTSLTSTALRGWTFGTWTARQSQALWMDVIWRRVIGDNLAGHLGVITILFGLIFLPGRRVLIAAGTALFLLFFMVFEHLLSLHEYYPFSNTVYLIFAFAVAIGGLIEARPRLTLLWVATVVGVVAINLSTYFNGHLFAEDSRQFDDTNPILATGKFMREHTPPNVPVLIYGDDWNSELPYYGQRKAFAVATGFKPYLEALDTPEKYLTAVPGAILVCSDARLNKDLVAKVAANYPTWTKTSLDMCDVYVKGP